MQDRLNFMLKGLISLALFFGLFLVFSCESSEPEILSVTSTCVFDYKDENSLPETTLSVYLQIGNEIQRASKIQLKNVEKDYLWIISDPALVINDGKKWAGYTGISFPEGEQIKNGKYTVEYFDVAEREWNSTINVSFPEELLNAKSAEARSKMKGSVTENIALYDESKNLIFYGRKKSNWKDNETIRNEYKDCYYSRICYAANNSSVVCMMPLKKLVEEISE